MEPASMTDAEIETEARAFMLLQAPQARIAALSKIGRDNSRRVVAKMAERGHEPSRLALAAEVARKAGD